MNEFIENLKRQAEENPWLAIGITAGLITSISQLMNAKTKSENAKSWKQETARRTMKDLKNNQ